MDWSQEPLSNNVDIQGREQRSYGSAEVLRNVKSNAVTAIDPVDLSNNCRGVLSERFLHAVNPEQWPMPSKTVSASLADMAAGDKRNDCIVKTEAFFKDAEKADLVVGAKLDVNKRTGDFEQKIFAVDKPYEGTGLNKVIFAPKP